MRDLRLYWLGKPLKLKTRTYKSRIKASQQSSTTHIIDLQYIVSPGQLSPSE